MNVRTGFLLALFVSAVAAVSGVTADAAWAGPGRNGTGVFGEAAQAEPETAQPQFRFGPGPSSGSGSETDSDAGTGPRADTGAEPDTVMPSCPAPSGWIDGQAPLPRVAEAVERGERLVVLVIGTASSTAVAVSAPARAYPERLEAELRARFSGLPVHVLNRSRFDQTAEDMLARFDDEVAAAKPALVVWETGTPDAIAGIESVAFSHQLDDGVERLQQYGSDVILVDPQYSPTTFRLLSEPSVTLQMQWVAQRKGISVFFRQDLMRLWALDGLYDPAPGGNEAEQRRQADMIHACLGSALAEQILVGLTAATEQAASEAASSGRGRMEPP